MISLVMGKDLWMRWAVLSSPLTNWHLVTLLQFVLREYLWSTGLLHDVCLRRLPLNCYFVLRWQGIQNKQGVYPINRCNKRRFEYYFISHRDSHDWFSLNVHRFIVSCKFWDLTAAMFRPLTSLSLKGTANFPLEKGHFYEKNVN